ncbi:MAG: hypothetical protein RL189_3162 [Pseudomonadota bacterium]|jgi:hypothetical protein
MKRSSSLLSLSSAAALVACSSGGKGTFVQRANCTGTKPSTTQALTSSFSLAGQEKAYPGAGYIDSVIESGGTRKELRCTMHVEPESEDNSTVRLWTAGHCSFDPMESDYLDAKMALKIYQDGSYYTVPIRLEYKQNIAKLAQFVKVLPAFSGNSLPPEALDAYVNISLFPQQRPEICQSLSDSYKLELGAAAKDILCFGESELNSTLAVVQADEKTQIRLKRTLAEVRLQRAAIFDRLTELWKRLFNLYLDAHKDTVRGDAWLRMIGYYLNEQFCAADLATRPLPDSVPRDFNMFCNSTYRPLIIARFQSMLPPAQFASMNSVIKDKTTPLSELFALNAQTKNIEPEDYALPAHQTSDGTFARLAKRIFERWTSGGINQLRQLNLENSEVFGFNEQSLFQFIVNKASSTSASGSVRPQFFSLNNLVERENVEFAKRQVLVNFDGSQNNFRLEKGDSGSMLTIFGGLPLGVLSTVNGEPTSGGASVTPLPEPDDENTDEKKVPSGC